MSVHRAGQGFAAPDGASGKTPGPAAARCTSSLAQHRTQDPHPAGPPQAGPVGARLWSRPSPRPRRDEKRVPFSALHPPAQTRGCAPVLRRKTAERGSFSYIGHTRVTIALFRQSCNLIPAQNLLTHSIKYGQKHRQKMSLPLPAIKNTTRLGGVFGSPSPDHADESALLSRTQRAPGTLLPVSRA